MINKHAFDQSGRRIVILVVILASVLIVLGITQLVTYQQPVAFREAVQTGAQDIPIIESAHPYANDYNNTWTVTNLDGAATATRVHFSRLDLEDRVDFIIITDVFGNEFQRITGVYTDGLWTDLVIGRDVKVSLVTDSNVGKWGFAIDQVETVAQPSLAYSTHPYTNDSTQSWTQTKASCGSSGTKLHLSRLDLEDGVDRIVVKDALDQEYQWITQSYPSGVWTAPVPGAVIKVQWVTDSSVTRWGFNVDQIECDTPISLATAITQTFKPALVETDHLYSSAISQTWTLVNPNSAAISTKIHFRRLSLGQNTFNAAASQLFVRDVDGRLMQTFTGFLERSDFWTTYIPGHVVKVQLMGNGYAAWGFQIDDIADGESKNVLAETEHDFAPAISQTWTLINPNSAATSTKIHFRRLSLGQAFGSVFNKLFIRDVDGRLMQTFTGSLEKSDFWTTYVPGHIVNIQIVGNGIAAWGIQVDDIADGDSKLVLAETEHDFAPAISQTWTLINPSSAATSTKIHFRRLSLRQLFGSVITQLFIRDVDGRLVQTFNGYFEQNDFWTMDVPGHIVKIQLVGNGVAAWGFQIDDIQPQGNATPVPAFIGGVYITVNAPGRVYLNDQALFYVSQPGEYKIRIPGQGKHKIRIEYMGGATQNININLDSEGNLAVGYVTSGSTPTPTPTATPSPPKHYIHLPFVRR